ncbi:hypothetical protein GC209_10710 [bacterium]|nr:hypothetical protein [bacterium]
MNNLDVSADAQANFSLGTLRAHTTSGKVISGKHIVPGVFFSIDSKSSDSVDIDSKPGDMMSIRVTSSGTGRWLTLHLSLGAVDFSETSVVGFMLRSQSDSTSTLRACVRSGIEGGHVDALFAKTIVSFPKSAVHLDMLELELNPDVPTKARWRELVFFLRRENAEILIKDLRVFVI